MANKTVEELWEIAQEINKKENTKEEILKEHGIRVRTWSDLLRNTPIMYKSNKVGYIWNENKINKAATKDKTDISTKNKNEINSVEKAGKGRPRKYSEGHKELKKLTLEIDKTVYQALKFKKITETITINEYIENLLRQNIEPVYFDTVEKLNK